MRKIIILFITQELRGRPVKSKAQSSQPEEEEVSEEPASGQKKKRGRPRKIADDTKKTKGVKKRHGKEAEYLIFTPSLSKGKINLLN